MFYFSAPWNNGKTKSFQTFLGGGGGVYKWNIDLKRVDIIPLGTNPTKLSNTLKRFLGKSQRIVECVDHFLGLALLFLLGYSFF